MIATTLEARVEPSRWADLVDAYAARTVDLPPGMVQTFLLHDTVDEGRWRIVSVWRDREALEAMRASAQTPGGVLIFRAAGAEPSLSVFDVAARATAGG